MKAEPVLTLVLPSPIDWLWIAAAGGVALALIIGVIAYEEYRRQQLLQLAGQ